MRTLHYFRGHALADRGTPLRCRQLIRSLHELGGRRSALLSPDSTVELEDALGIEHFELGDKRIAVARLQQILATWKPDVVLAHTHSSAFDLARSGSAAAKLADLHGDLAAEKLENRELPLFRRLKGYLRGRIGSRRAFPKIDGFTAVSDALADRLGAYGKPVAVLLGGVDLALFQPQPADRAQRGRIGYAGGFRSYHGLPDLVAAVERLNRDAREFELLLVGDPGSLAGFEAQTSQQLGDAVTFAGRVSHSQVPELLGSCEILAVPRRAGRSAAMNYPSKLSEFMALGRPLVVTEVGQAATVVRQAEAGLVVSPGSPAALAAAFGRLRDRELGATLAANGQRFAERRLAWPRIAEQLADFIELVRSSAGGA